MSLRSDQVPLRAVGLVSDQVRRGCVGLVSDRARGGRIGSVGARVGPARALPQMLRERVTAVDSDGFDQLLGRQPLRDRGGVRAGKPGDRLELREARFPFPTDEGERARLLVREMRPETRLKQDLFLGQESFLEEGQLKGFPRLVVLDDRRNAAEPPPVAENGADAGPGLLAQTDAAEGGHDPGVANLPLAGFHEFFGRHEGVARIPQRRAVVEEPDRRLARVVGVVLVDQQVDRGFPEGDVIRRSILPPQRFRVDGEGLFRTLHVAAHKRLPGLYEVGLDHQPVGPSFLRQVLRPVAAAPLQVDDRTGQYLAKRGIRAEQKDRRACRRRPAIDFDDQAPMAKELHMCQ